MQKAANGTLKGRLLERERRPFTTALIIKHLRMRGQIHLQTAHIPIYTYSP